jgi:hypothetical protein
MLDWRSSAWSTAFDPIAIVAGGRLTFETWAERPYRMAGLWRLFCREPLADGMSA